MNVQKASCAVALPEQTIGTVQHGKRKENEEKIKNKYSEGTGKTKKNKSKRERGSLVLRGSPWLLSSVYI